MWIVSRCRLGPAQCGQASGMLSAPATTVLQCRNGVVDSSLTAVRNMPGCGGIIVLGPSRLSTGAVAAEADHIAGPGLVGEFEVMGEDGHRVAVQRGFQFGDLGVLLAELEP